MGGGLQAGIARICGQIFCWQRFSQVFRLVKTGVGQVWHSKTQAERTFTGHIQRAWPERVSMVVTLCLFLTAYTNAWEALPGPCMH